MANIPAQWLVFRTGVCDIDSMGSVSCYLFYLLFRFLTGLNIDSVLKERFGFLISVLNVQACKKIPVYFFSAK